MLLVNNTLNARTTVKHEIWERVEGNAWNRIWSQLLTSTSQRVKGDVREAIIDDINHSRVVF